MRGRSRCEYQPSNYEGAPCRGCGEIIQVWSQSGYCRRCWHERRGSDEKGLSQEERIERTLKRHAKDKNHYHFLTISGISIAEHRYVLEKVTGKPIPENWVVHHLNGLKGDNRPENLYTLPRSDHDSKMIVNALKERIRQLEAICGQ